MRREEGASKIEELYKEFREKEKKVFMFKNIYDLTILYDVTIYIKMQSNDEITFIVDDNKTHNMDLVILSSGWATNSEIIDVIIDVIKRVKGDKIY